MLNKTKILLKKIDRLFVSKYVNKKAVVRYLDQSISLKTPITFFNWEFYDQLVKEENETKYFYLNFDFKETKIFRQWQKEKKFFDLLKGFEINYYFYKFIPDEEIFLLWPEIFLKIDQKKFEEENRNFVKNLQDFAKDKIDKNVKVVRLSKYLQNQDFADIYWKSYNKVLFSFGKNYESPFVSKKKFKEDLDFRTGHYSSSSQPIINKRQTKELSVQMFALFAAETSLLVTLEKRNILPNLVLINNEPALTIKKYDTLKKIEKRETLPIIYPFGVDNKGFQ